MYAVDSLLGLISIALAANMQMGKFNDEASCQTQIGAARKIFVATHFGKEVALSCAAIDPIDYKPGDTENTRILEAKAEGLNESVFVRDGGYNSDYYYSMTECVTDSARALKERSKLDSKLLGGICAKDPYTEGFLIFLFDRHEDPAV
jgi:hypothetical protein